ncbi:MAG: tetratricopeptide repeat protein [Planctomycetaceae bacterium]|nr:tetratricopeptide repeat protein [Planctomycetaceae bacterium]
MIATTDKAPGFVSRKSWLLLLLVFITYLPVTGAGYIWDDPQYVTENKELRTLSGLWRIWTSTDATPQYYPMVFSSFWLEYHLWKLNPLGYHVNNVLLHALNSLLLYRLLLRLNVRGAFWAAIIFGVHPVHVESVAWITERKNVLSAFFYLLAFHGYWRYLHPGDTVTETPRKRCFFYAAAMLCFAAALLSKSVTASLPAAILVVLWWKHGRITGRQVLTLLPFVLLGVAAGLHTAHVESQHVGAEGAEWNWTVWERVLIAGRAVWFYAMKLTWPYPLVFIYHRWKIDSSSVVQTLYPVTAIILLLVLLTGRSRWGRGPLAAALLFGGTLVPALGFVNLYPMRFSFVADHFQYLASISMIALLTTSGIRAFARCGVTPRNAQIMAALIVVVLSGLSFVRCFDYRDRETLWTATLEDNSDCWLASLHLGGIRMEQYRFREALDFFELTLANKPPESFEPSEMSDLHIKMGDCWAAIGNPAGVEKHTRSALECLRLAVGDRYQDQSVVHFNLAMLHRSLGEFAESITEFQKSLELAPENATTHLELGSVLLHQQQFEDSRDHFLLALHDNRENPHLHLQLGMAYRGLEQPELALEHLQRALELKPDLDYARTVLNEVTARHLNQPAPHLP